MSDNNPDGSTPDSFADACAATAMITIVIAAVLFWLGGL